MASTISRWIGAVLLASTLVLPASSAYAAPSLQAGVVFTSSNAASGNAVLVYQRAGDGKLSALASVPTGGLGTGAGLGSQGALALSRDGDYLFVVNAGSNDITSFRVEHDGLRFADRIASGGMRPTSLTVHQNLLYVLNAGGDGAITGFKIGRRGDLEPLPNSTRPLSGTATQPAQVSFSRDGDILAVTERATQRIVTYRVANNGLPGNPMVHPSSGATPFGFEFGRHDTLVVSEASGGVSSYEADGNTFRLIDGSVPTHQTAACWLVVTQDGRYAYTANAGSASISGFRVRHDGDLSPLSADGRTAVTSAHPIDMAISRGDRFLYQLADVGGMVDAFRINNDGSLAAIGSVPGVPASVAGLVAR